MTGQSPSPTAGGPYYIRTRGRVQGPLSVAKLKLLRARGQFGRASEVSLDGLIWSPAAAFPELFDLRSAESAQSASVVAQQADGALADAPVETVLAAPDRSSPNWKAFMLAGMLLMLSVSVVAMTWVSITDDSHGVDDIDASAGNTSSIAVDDLVGEVRHSGLPELSSAVNTSELTPPDSRNAEDTIRSEPVDALAEAPSEPKSASERGPIISSATGSAEEAAREAALGLVVCGFEIELSDGTIKEICTERGTSFLVSDHGDVITNRHVIEATLKLLRSENARAELKRDFGAVLSQRVLDLEPRIWVFFGRTRYVAEIAHSSTRFDLAVLRTGHSSQPHFALSADAEPPKSTQVYALGFPGAADQTSSAQAQLASDFAKTIAVIAPTTDLHVEQLLSDNSFEFTLSDGLISRKPYADDGSVWIQHTAAINRGNSGGPLLLGDARVVGINTLLAADAQGIFIALGIEQLREEIDAHVPGVVWR